MAVNYYVRSGGQISGPFDVAALKSLVQQGGVTRQDEISNDQITWNAASRYPKLFPSETAVSALAATTTAAAAVAPMPVDTDGRQSLGYYAPTTDFNNLTLQRRSVIPFTVVAGLMLAMSLFTLAYAVFGNNSPRNLSDFTFVIATTCTTLLLTGAAFVLWLVWVGGVHRDIKAITDGQYSVSPGMAVGFSCIPLFDAFWIVYMPWRMASELNRPLEGRGLKKIPVAAVMTMQIISIVFAIFIPGITMAMYAGSMMFIQGGLNRLSRSTAPE